MISGAFSASSEVGMRVGIAIVLHKFPDGFVLSSLLQTGKSKHSKRTRSMLQHLLFSYTFIIILINDHQVFLVLSILSSVLICLYIIITIIIIIIIIIVTIITIIQNRLKWDGFCLFVQ
jgi:hypothetical protein